MVDESRLKTMIRLASFEAGKRGRDLRIRRFSLRDHMLLEAVRTFFLTTVGFAALLVLVVMGNMTFVLDHLSSVDIRALLIMLVFAYLGLLTVYMVISLVRAYMQYRQAEEHTRHYEKDLRRLERSYRRSEL